MNNDTYGYNDYFNEYDREQRRIEIRCKVCESCGQNFDPMDMGGIRYWHDGYRYVCSDCAQDLEDVTEEELIDGIDHSDLQDLYSYAADDRVTASDAD